MNFNKIFRLTFVVFFLYLMGDAFYRWDGFKYYASFPEFLPSVALISVMWIVFAAFAALCMWLFYKAVGLICMALRLKADNEQVFLGSGLTILLGVTVAAAKKFYLTSVHTTSMEKGLVLLAVILVSLFLAWVLRNMAKGLLDSLLDRVTPLVWLFGAIVAVSIPVTIFYALSELPDRNVLSVSQDAGAGRPNIILVTYDALTAENMSLHGYERETTPFIKEWASSATVFEKCQAAANNTYSAVPSLLTGKRVWSHRRHQSDAGKPSRAEAESMSHMLKKNGYYNMAFVANQKASVKKLGMSGTFDVEPSSSETLDPASLYGVLYQNLIRYFGVKILLHDWILKEDFILGAILQMDFIKYPYRNEYPAKKVFDMFFDKVETIDREPYFAWIHLMPPHAPYLAPKEYVGMFDASPRYRTAKDQYALINPRYYTPEQQGDVDIIRARYDEFVRYCDDEFRDFIARLSENEKTKDSILIFSSDHGESFEHGMFRHGNPALYEEQTNIPLIIKLPGQGNGRVLDLPVDMTDIPATVLGLADIQVPSWMEGRSLVPLLNGGDMEPAPAFSMYLDRVPARGNEPIRGGIYAVWEGAYKLIHNMDTGETLLFNLKNDPDELDDLKESEPEVAQRLLELIKDNLSKANERIRGRS